MVLLANSGNLGADSEAPHPSKAKVKLEIEDPLDEEHGPLSKRSKNSAPHQEQWSTGISNISSRPTHYNPLDEPSPLGLRLRKSPSLLELIQMKLSQGSTAVTGVTKGENLNLGKKDTKGNSAAATSDKLKASNFPVSILRIGSWKCVSRYEGDLVAKCYFAKHKLVWEVLDGGLKSKIEIQWSDIMGLRATYPDNEPGNLDVVLARQPLFFRETNPQPRKHTLWQATSDFTGGQASLHRRHFLQCPPGLLNKHFEKLIVCDPRLNMLSQQPEIVLDSPYFEPRNAVFDDQDESKCHSFDHLKSDYVSTFAGLQDAPSPSAAQSSSSMSELRDPVGVTEVMPHGIPSPSSVMDTRAMEENASSEAEGSKLPSQWDQFKVPGLHPSMSMSDLVTHIGNCISEQMTSGDPLLVEEGSRSKDMLEELTQYLLSDSHFSSGSDEQRLMSRVNSLCCLIQRDVSTAQNSQVKTEACAGIMDSRSDEPNTSSRSPCELKAGDFSASGGETSDMSGRRQPPAMSRKDSVGDLLLHLPRIASLPQFLFNIAEDVDSKAR